MLANIKNFLERKDHLIRRHPDFNTLSLEQQNHLLNYFSSRDKPLSLNIDWNKLASYSIQDILKATYELSKTGKKRAVKKSGIEGLREGEDYLEFPMPDPNIKAYIPLNYETSKLIASSRIGPCEGKWCTAYQKTDEYWSGYSKQGIIFIYIIAPKTKYAIAVYANNKLKIYDARDKVRLAKTLSNRLGIDIKAVIQQNWALIKKARSHIADVFATKKRESLKYLDGSIPVPNKDIIKELISNNLDISRLDVSRITDMSYLFQNSRFNGDISKWNVSNVRNMAGMFDNAAFFNGDISNWDVSNVTNMAGMFQLATSFNGDISKWNVSNVTDMSGMFRFAKSFNSDISNWDVSNVTNMSEMFYFARSFTSDISNWDVSRVNNMNKMFYHSSFSGDISSWDISNVINADSIFKGSPLERRYPNGLDDLGKEQRLKENVLKDWLYEEFL